jgi:hypothetical protein
MPSLLSKPARAQHLLVALQAQGLLEVAAGAETALARRLATWVTGRPGGAPHALTEVGDWLVRQDEVSELFADTAALVATFGRLLSSLLPGDAKTVLERGRPSLPALVDRASGLFTWHLARSRPADGTPYPLVLRLASPLILVAQAPVGRAPFAEPGLMLELDPASHGEAGTAAKNPSDEDLLTAVALASRLEPVSAALRHATGDTELRVFDGAAQDLEALSVTLPLHGPLPDLGQLARSLRRAARR